MGSLRDDLLAIQGEVADVRPPLDPCHVFVGVVDSETSGWEDAQVYYYVVPQTLGGPEVEGGPVSRVPDGGRVLAANLGSSVPGRGTSVLVASVPNRYAFVFNGA